MSAPVRGVKLHPSALFLFRQAEGRNFTHWSIFPRTDILTNSTDPRTSLEPAMSSASQEIVCVLWNLKALSFLILSFHLRLVLPAGLYPWSLSTKTLCATFLTLIRATCVAHIILLDFIIPVRRGGFQSWSFSLCSLLHSPTPYSQILSTYVPPSMWETKFHTHTKQQTKLQWELVVTYIIYKYSVSTSQRTQNCSISKVNHLLL